MSAETGGHSNGGADDEALAGGINGPGTEL